MLGVEDVQSLIDKSTKLFDDEHPFPLDPATVLYRSVRKAHSEQNKPFALSDWIHESIIKPLLEGRSLSPDERIFVLSGRAGQGKSTVLRHLFVHLCEQQDGIDPRIRPNFRTQFDADLSQFFKDFQDSAHYIQARKLSEHVEFQRNLSQLIFIDGLDEANEDYKIEAMAQLMIDNPSSIFLVSGRSRSNPEIGNLHKEEIIQLEKLQNQLQKKNCSVNLLQNSVYLEDLTHKEKKGLLSLIAQVDPKQAGKASTLHTLVENNSSILQRPADFLVYKAKNPKTKSEFFIEHLKWLVEREASKDDERTKLVKSLAFPRAFDLEHRDFAEKGRLVLSPELDDASIHALRLFNLVESTLVYNYLDLATPAARGLLLLSFSDIQSSVELIANQEVLNLEQMVGSFASSSLFFSMWKDVISRLHDSPFYESSVSLLNGYIDNNLFANIQFEGHFDGDSEDSPHHQSLIHQAMWMADVAHPVDELKHGYSVGPIHSLLHHAVRNVIATEKAYITCGICKNEFAVKGEASKVILDCKCDKRKPQNGNSKSIEWFEFRLNPLLTLFRRLSFIGPHAEKIKIFSTDELQDPYNKDNETHLFQSDNCLFKEMYQLVYKMGILFSIDTGDSAYSTLANFVRPSDSIIKQNENSKSRVFLTVLYLLRLGEGKDMRRHRRTKFDIFIQPILKYARYPNDWNPSLLIEYDSEDLLYLHWVLMGSTSQYSNDIVTTFIHKGISPNLKYSQWRPDQSKPDTLTTDYLARAIKFLGQIEQQKSDPYLRSIIRAYLMLSRIGHMLPRNKYGYSVSTLGPDIGQLMFHDHNPGTILDEYQARSNKIFPIIEANGIPAVFIQHYQRTGIDNNLKFQKNMNWLHNFLQDNNFPTLNLQRPMFPIESEAIHNWLEKLADTSNGLQFLEYFATTFGLIFPTPDKIIANHHRVHLRRGLLRLIRSGEFFASLLMAMRTPETDLLSILVECDLSEDGFNSPKSSIAGNYAHRRIISQINHSDSPNNIDFVKYLFMSFVLDVIGNESGSETAAICLQLGEYVSCIFEHDEERIEELMSGATEQQREFCKTMTQAWENVRRRFRLPITKASLNLIPTVGGDIHAYIPKKLVRSSTLKYSSALDSILQHLSAREGENMNRIGFRLVEDIHNDPTEKSRNRLNYAVYIEDIDPWKDAVHRQINGESMTKIEFIEKFDPQKKRKTSTLWTEAVRQINGESLTESKFIKKFHPKKRKTSTLWTEAVRQINGESMTKIEFIEKFHPKKRKTWTLWREAHRQVNGESMSKVEFIDKFHPRKKRKTSTLWTEAVRQINGESMSKIEFIESYNPDENPVVWDLWNGAVGHVGGEWINEAEFLERYNPNENPRIWDLWYRAVGHVGGEWINEDEFLERYNPNENPRIWELWNNALLRKIGDEWIDEVSCKELLRKSNQSTRALLHRREFFSLPPNHRSVNGEIITKSQFRQEFVPEENTDAWDIWNNGEAARYVFGKLLLENEFTQLYGSSGSKMTAWDKAGYVHFSHSDYLEKVLPVLFFEKYRPKRSKAESLTEKAATKSLAIANHFAKWLFETNSEETGNRKFPNFSKSIKPHPITTTHGLKFGDAEVINSWHTSPFFAPNISGDVVLDDVIKIITNSQTTVQKLFIHHLSEDELVFPGSNLRITWNPKSKSYSFFGGMEVEPHHSKSEHFHYTQGMFSLSKIKDITSQTVEEENGDDEDDEELIETHASVDIKTFPAGLRSLSRFYGVFENDRKFDGDIDDVVFASSRLSSLKHRFVVNPSYEVYDTGKKSVNTSILHKDEDLPSTWISIARPWNGYNNPVYGRKFGIIECEDDEEECLEGFAEWKYLRFSSNIPRKVLTTFVESSDTYLDDPLFASPGWKGLFDEAINLPQQLEAVKANPDESKPGNRMSRVFGIITDTGMFDPFKLEQIQHSMNKVRVNLEQLRSGERVQAGRTNLLNLIRDITTSFSYSSWVGNSLEVYMDVKSDVLALLQDIESAEHEIMGLNLTGTLRDFEVIRAILDGLNAQHDEHMRRLLEQKEELEKQLLSNEVGINDFKTTVRKLAKHLDQAMLDEIKRHAVASFGPLLENRIGTWCVPRKELSVRVLGMPQSSYPFSLTTTWAETLGSLQKDGPLNTKVGSLVRLDLKLNPKAGTLEPLITNIAYAKDELNSDGSLHENYVFLSESVSKWPEPLPHDTFFSIKTTNQDVKQRSNFMVPLHVKMERGYATHPNLNVEIPLFEPAQALADHDGGGSITSGELCDCTVDIRRDRGTGLFRYYVSAIQKRPN